MYAEIYPITKLPRSFGAFDYQIPEGIKLHQGSLVVAPFRNRELRGIVSQIKESTQEQNVKPILRVIDSSFIDQTTLAVYESLAEQIFQSVSSVLDAAFPPVRQKGSTKFQETQERFINKVRASEVEFIKEAVVKIKAGGHRFIEVTDLVQTAAVIEPLIKKSPGQVLILTPHIHDSEIIASLISEKTILLDSRSTKINRGDVASLWHRGKIKTLIATRIGSLFPAQDLKHIFVVHASSPEHAQYDQNPRYDSRELARLFHRATGASLTFFDTLPRLCDTQLFREAILKNDFSADSTLISLKDEREQNNFPYLSEKVLDLAKKALQKGQKVLLSYNRKGVAPRLFCKDCQMISECSQCHCVASVYETELACHRCGWRSALPLECPSCHSVNLSRRGTGNREIEKRLKQQFPDKRVVRAEKGSDQFDGDIILATQYYFESIYHPAKHRFGLVAELGAELGLSEPFYTATENTLLKLRALQGLAAREQCPLVIQTWSRELIETMLREPESIMKAEAEVREHFVYPPFGTMLRIRLRGESNPGQVLAKLERDITAVDESIITNINLAKKPYLEIRTKKINSRTQQLLQKLPNSYIIEINPPKAI